MGVCPPATLRSLLCSVFIHRIAFLAALCSTVLIGSAAATVEARAGTAELSVSEAATGTPTFKLHYHGGAGETNRVTVRFLDSEVRISDAAGVKAGRRCKRVAPNRTLVRCATRGEPINVR